MDTSIDIWFCLGKVMHGYRHSPFAPCVGDVVVLHDGIYRVLAREWDWKSLDKQPSLYIYLEKIADE